MERINLTVYGDGPSGMRLDGGGGGGGGINGATPIYVSKLHKRGRARHAGIKLGDEVLSINGFPSSRMELQEAQDLVRNTSNIHMEIIRRPGSHWLETELARAEDRDTDASGIRSPMHRGVFGDWGRQPDAASPMLFRTTNGATLTAPIPIYVSNADDEAANRTQRKQQQQQQQQHQQYDQYQQQQQQHYDHYDQHRSNRIDLRSMTSSPSGRHVTRAYIVPENNRDDKPWSVSRTRMTPVDIRWKASGREEYPAGEQESPSFRGATEHFSDPFVPRHTQEVVVWSSRDTTLTLPGAEGPGELKTRWEPSCSAPKKPSPPPPPMKPFEPHKPRSPPRRLPPPPVAAPPPPSTAPLDTPDSSKVIVNENLIDSGLLTRGFVSAAGIPVEMQLEKKKLFSDSSFYQDPGHTYPTIEEQIKMARRVANLLTAPTTRTGKGQRMFLKRREMSSKWVTHLDPLVEASLLRQKEERKFYEDDGAHQGHVGEGPFDRSSRAARAAELEKMRLKEEKSLHNVVPFDLCARLASELHQLKGRGGELFAKIKARSEQWVTAESDPIANQLRGPRDQTEPMEFTPFRQQQQQQHQQQELKQKQRQQQQQQPQTHTFNPTFPVQTPRMLFDETNRTSEMNVPDARPQNRLKDMISHPKFAMSPWDSVIETGSVEKAFEHLDHDPNDALDEHPVLSGRIVSGHQVSSSSYSSSSTYFNASNGYGHPHSWKADFSNGPRSTGNRHPGSGHQHHFQSFNPGRNEPWRSQTGTV